MHRGRRRGSPQLRLRLRFRGNRSGGPRRRGGARWRGCDPRLASRSGGSGGPDRGPRAGATAGSERRGPGVRIDCAWRYRSTRRRGWRAPGARNRQRIGPRQGLVSKAARPAHWPAAARSAFRPARAGQAGPRGRIDRGARRYRRLALLDQRGPLRHRRRQCRRGATLPRRHRRAGASAGLGAKSGIRPAPARRLRPPVDDVVDDGPCCGCWQR